MRCPHTLLALVALLGLASPAMAGSLLFDDDHGHGAPHGLCPCCAAHYDLKHGRVDTHGPAGVMGDHVHEQGEWMVEYKFSQMFMDGNRVGSQRVDFPAAYNATGDNFAVLPTRMNMDMHMIHVMYGLTDRVTLYVMPMFMSLTMDHRRGPRTGAMNGTFFRTHNDGFADLPIGALWRVYEGHTDELIVNLGLSLPTGNIDRRVDGGGEFPYPMRLGSGTVDLLPGVTYKYYTERSTFAAQLQTDIPLGENYSDYGVGSAYSLNFWATRCLDRNRNLAVSFRTQNLWTENFRGADPDLAMAAANNIVSTVRTDMRGGYWLNFGYGIMYLLPEGSRLNCEFVHPVYQDLDGIQLETDWSLFASWSRAF